MLAFISLELSPRSLRDLHSQESERAEKAKLKSVAPWIPKDFHYIFGKHTAPVKASFGFGYSI
jgi:hypothetical protein